MERIICYGKLGCLRGILSFDPAITLIINATSVSAKKPFPGEELSACMEKLGRGCPVDLYHALQILEPDSQKAALELQQAKRPSPTRLN
jgi:hypothetical protein